MPNPKRRHSKARKKSSRAHFALKTPQFVACSNCGELTLPHKVCQSCGHYGGVQFEAKEA